MPPPNNLDWKYSIPTQVAGNALVTLLGLQMCMGGDDHLLSEYDLKNYSRLKQEPAEENGNKSSNRITYPAISETCGPSQRDLDLTGPHRLTDVVLRTVSRCGLEAVIDRCHRCGDDVRNRLLNVET
ncbi:hypothetical protein EVAR_93550_1 [Eumeta japonica]|uniref:Uncharacterized protein n=1 Tax=Eumeta variegata TaxID=151549 RepID=A0A4C1UR28_EUMVA|nr:hypothetical protein EVAR_93550_1 [Eumeta japonica]